MMTNAGDRLFKCLGHAVGRLIDGALADLVVVKASVAIDPFKAIVAATEKDAQVVVIDRHPRPGPPSK